MNTKQKGKKSPFELFLDSELKRFNRALRSESKLAQFFLSTLSQPQTRPVKFIELQVSCPEQYPSFDAVSQPDKPPESSNQ